LVWAEVREHPPKVPTNSLFDRRVGNLFAGSWFGSLLLTPHGPDTKIFTRGWAAAALAGYLIGVWLGTKQRNRLVFGTFFTQFVIPVAFLLPVRDLHATRWSSWCDALVNSLPCHSSASSAHWVFCRWKWQTSYLP